MKGLLIKDIMLLKKQLRVYLLITLCGLFLSIEKSNMGFMIGYVMFCMSMFSITSVAYDEMNHGMTFLLTLPVTKKQYAVEKYLFGIIMILISSITSFIFVGIGTLITGIDVSISECLFTAGVVALVLMIFIAVNLPVQLKFGPQKARGIMYGIAGVLALVMYGFSMFVQSVQVGFAGLIDFNPAVLCGVFTLIVSIIYFISMIISCRIMNSKEL